MLSAYHEAGHAVVAHDQGIRVFGISLVPVHGKTGNSRIDTLFLDRVVPTFRSDKGARNRFTMERHVMVLLGGSAAACRLDPEQGKRDTGEIVPVKGSDQGIALSLLLEFTASREEADKYYEWLKVRTEGIVASSLRWFQIEGLARALLELEELGTRKVREIIKDAQLRWCNEHGGENST